MKRTSRSTRPGIRIFPALAAALRVEILFAGAGPDPPADGGSGP